MFGFLDRPPCCQWPDTFSQGSIWFYSNWFLMLWGLIWGWRLVHLWYLVAPHCYPHLVCLLLLGPYDVDYVSLCEFSILEGLIPVNKNSGVSAFNVSNASEDMNNLVVHGLTPPGFFYVSHEVEVVLCLACVGEDDCIYHYRVEGDVPCIIFYYHIILFHWAHYCVQIDFGGIRWFYSRH